MVDPHKTAATGKVEIGAFRTYPQGYKPPDEGPSEFESVPLGKIEDFGAHHSIVAWQLKMKVPTADRESPAFHSTLGFAYLTAPVPAPQARTRTSTTSSTCPSSSRPPTRRCSTRCGTSAPRLIPFN